MSLVDHSINQSGASLSGVVDHSINQPGASLSGVVDHSINQPGASPSGLVDHSINQPGASLSGLVDHSINQSGASLCGVVDHDLLCISTPGLFQCFCHLFYTQLLHQLIQHLFHWFPVLYSLSFITGVKRYLSYSLLIACIRKFDCQIYRLYFLFDMSVFHLSLDVQKQKWFITIRL